MLESCCDVCFQYFLEECEVGDESEIVGVVGVKARFFKEGGSKLKRWWKSDKV